MWCLVLWPARGVRLWVQLDGGASKRAAAGLELQGNQHPGREGGNSSVVPSVKFIKKIDLLRKGLNNWDVRPFVRSWQNCCCMLAKIKAFGKNQQRHSGS